MRDRFTILMDGGFVKKRLGKVLGHPVSAQDIVAFSKEICDAPALEGKVLFRVFFYDASPFQDEKTHPISRKQIRYAQSEAARKNEKLHGDLALQPMFAVRRGVLLHHGWRLTREATQELMQDSRPLVEEDIEADFQQKQVDIKIGLDIAWTALKGIAETIVVVTGDSDFVPALKFARKEGLRVFLHTLGMGNQTREELRAHVDVVLG